MQTRVSPDTGKLERVSTALLFERVVFLPVGSSPAFHQPLQIAYCGKVKNGGKLSSHQVFFDGFCRAVDPDYVFLVDVGTRPSPMSIVRLYAAMEADESVGGCCGDIAGATIGGSGSAGGRLLLDLTFLAPRAHQCLCVTPATT